MLVLSLDTSTSVGRVALVDVVSLIPTLVGSDGVTTIQTRLLAANLAEGRVAEELMGAIDKTFQDAGFGLRDIDLIAVGIGPGSFTGTRIGLATAKGLAFGANKRLVGVNSFLSIAWAWQFLAPRAEAILPAVPTQNDLGLLADPIRVCVAVDARKSELYVAKVDVFRDQSTLPTLSSQPIHLSLELARTLAQDLPVIGDGAVLFNSPSEIHPSHVPATQQPDPLAIAALATWAHDPKTSSTDFHTLEPMYVRPPDISQPKRRAPTLR